MLGNAPLGVAPLSTLDGAAVEVSAVGTAAGTSTVTGVGATGSVGTVAGTSTVAGVGSSEARSAGTVAGTSTVAGVGSSEARSAGTVAATSTVAGVGSSQARTSGSAAGTATTAGVARADTRAVGTSAGTSTVAGVATYSADTVSWTGVRDPTIAQRGKRGAWAETLGAAVSVMPGRATRFELHTEDSLSLTARSVDLKIGLPVPVGSDDEPTIPIDVAMAIDSASQASVLVGAALTAQIGAGYRYAVVLADADDLPCVHGRVTA